MRSHSRTLLAFAALAPTATVAAQAPTPSATGARSAIASPAANPLTTHYRMIHLGLKRFLLGSAERMPESRYSFRPVGTVRSFGEIIGHVVDKQYEYCSIVLGEPHAAPAGTSAKAGKPQLLAALREAFAYCDRVYSNLTDAWGMETVQYQRMAMPRFAVLDIGGLHNAEHYGNLVTYLRLNGIVPPSSDPGGTAAPKP